MRRCRHKWIEVRRVFVTSSSMVGELKTTGATLRDALFGFTAVELRCEHCGDLAERTLSGDHT